MTGDLALVTLDLTHGEARVLAAALAEYRATALRQFGEVPAGSAVAHTFAVWASVCEDVRERLLVQLPVTRIGRAAQP